MATTKDIQACFNPHFDAVSLWIGSFGGADSPCDISRGVFAARQGVPRERTGGAAPRDRCPPAVRARRESRRNA